MTIDGYENVPRNNEYALMKAVAHQPVAVSIASRGSDFKFYGEASVVNFVVVNYNLVQHN